MLPSILSSLLHAVVPYLLIAQLPVLRAVPLRPLQEPPESVTMIQPPADLALGKAHIVSPPRRAVR